MKAKSQNMPPDEEGVSNNISTELLGAFDELGGELTWWGNKDAWCWKINKGEKGKEITEKWWSKEEYL